MDLHEEMPQVSLERCPYKARKGHTGSDNALLRAYSCLEALKRCEFPQSASFLTFQSAEDANLHQFSSDPCLESLCAKKSKY